MIAQGHIRTPFNRDAAVRCEWAFGPIDIIPDTSRKRVPAADQKVAMLSMCGVHLGPLYSISTSSVIQPYLQWFENAAARELFEFQESSSAVSVAYQKALSMVLENGVKVLLLASLNDQVVSVLCRLGLPQANHFRSPFTAPHSPPQPTRSSSALCSSTAPPTRNPTL